MNRMLPVKAAVSHTPWSLLSGGTDARVWAVVTGAGSGIGRAASLALASRNVNVLGVGRRIEALAETFEIRPLEVQEVISFYNMFYDKPQGRHHVYVCTNLPCSLRGGRTLLRVLEQHLGIRAGETTPDGRITLGHEECLGACAYAPMLRVDSRYCESLDADAAREIVDRLE